MKKGTILVLAIILIPIVVLGAIAVNGAPNLSEEHGEGQGNETANSTAEVVAPFPTLIHEYQTFSPLQTEMKV